MALQKVLVYKGETSQTGAATKRRFPLLPIDFGDSFLGILKSVQEEKALGVLPIWNSHEGEITRAQFFKELFSQNIKAYCFWVSRIQFQSLRRLDKQGRSVESVISVHVAEKQCSRYIDSLGVPFIGFDSTNEAVDECQLSLARDMVLSAPSNKWDPSILYKEEALDVANQYNFTTFVLCGKVDSDEWGDNRWQCLRDELMPARNNLIGVQMPVPGKLLTDEQNTFLDQVFEQATDLNSIPKAIFVYNRSAVECGILFEVSPDILFSSVISEDVFAVDIVVKEGLGETRSQYIQEISMFLATEFQGMLNKDFIKHTGKDAYFFACPVFNIMTHGFNEKVTELIVRALIFRCFQLVDQGVICTDEQKAFFEKYKEQYLLGDQFIQFS